MTIAPMSSASAPAQCKSRQEKKDEKTMDKITQAEQRRDAAVAGAKSKLEERDFRKAFADEIGAIVDNMSDRQLHSKQFQSRMVGIASSAANAGLKTEMAKDTGNKPAEDYSTILRGSEVEPEQRGMNRMMYRLMGGTEHFRSRLKEGTGPEDRLSSIVDDIAGNEDVTSMLTQFRDETFEGINKGVMTDPTAQNNAVMSNLFTRTLIRAGTEGADVGKNDPVASKNAAGVNKLLATDKVTGQLANNQSQAAQRASALLGDLHSGRNASKATGDTVAHEKSDPEIADVRDNLEIFQNVRGVEPPRNMTFRPGNWGDERVSGTGSLTSRSEGMPGLLLEGTGRSAGLADSAGTEKVHGNTPKKKWWQFWK